MRHERADHTLQATALIHEAYLALLKSECDCPTHLLGAAIRAMRQHLIMHARRRNALKRTAHRAGNFCDETIIKPDRRLTLEHSLAKLRHANPRAADVVEFRVLGSMTISEIASYLGVSRRTVDGDWKFAKAVLAAELAE